MLLMTTNQQCQRTDGKKGACVTYFGPYISLDLVVVILNIQNVFVFEEKRVSTFWPTVLSVEPLVQCVVCRLSVVCLSSVVCL